MHGQASRALPKTADPMLQKNPKNKIHPKNLSDNLQADPRL